MREDSRVRSAGGGIKGSRVQGLRLQLVQPDRHLPFATCNCSAPLQFVCMRVTVNARLFCLGSWLDRTKAWNLPAHDRGLVCWQYVARSAWFN